MKKTALIMAGGRGERFWPKSRQNMPKQFLPLTDTKKTMLQLTIERILPFVTMEDIFVVTNRGYRELICQQLPELPVENILCEPIGKNTAPCIGLGAIYMARKYGDATMTVLPSDHLIKNTTMFLDTLATACETAEQGDNLVTIGVEPNYPETGYGYIKFCSKEKLGYAFAVESFIEKPELEVAKSYLTGGQYLWNSGMFIWKVSTILRNLETYLPETYRGLHRIGRAIGEAQEKQVLEREFNSFKADSIDYSVMEHAKNIYVIKATFGWDDVGSWGAISHIRNSDNHGNVVDGNVVAVNTRNSIIQGERKLIAAVGLDNIIIVDSGDAMLICAKEYTSDIKKVLEALQMSNRKEYL